MHIWTLWCSAKRFATNFCYLGCVVVWLGSVGTPLCFSIIQTSTSDLIYTKYTLLSVNIAFFHMEQAVGGRGQQSITGSVAPLAWQSPTRPISQGQYYYDSRLNNKQSMYIVAEGKEHQYNKTM